LPADVPCTVLNDAEGEDPSRDVPLARKALSRPWIVWKTIRRLRHHLDDLRPHVVVSNINQVNCVTASALRGASHQPAWIARVGNNPAQEDRWTSLWARSSYLRAHQIVANSYRLAENVALRYTNHGRQVRVIGNPTDFELIDNLTQESSSCQSEDAYPVLMSVGRLAKQKRPDVLLDAFTLVRRRIPAHLWVCGDGPMREALQREIVFRGLDASVRLFGFCNNPYPLMRQAAVFALTSDYEGLPNALIEAQGLGVPAVATRCDYGPDEVIQQGRTGYLVAPGNAQAVAEAVVKLLKNSARRLEMGRAAARRARRLYDAATLVAQWEDLLVECAMERRDSCVLPPSSAA
jgi:glycosyltransferase involved in cell wall biosynthesis